VKKIIPLWIFAVLLSACSRNPGAAPAPKSVTVDPLKATVWTPKGELFLEYPPMAANSTGRFAVHLTRLNDFKAVKEASCEVHLEYDTQSAEDFRCDPSTHPGIFGVNVEPRSSGKARMSVRVQGKELTETFDVGPVNISADGKVVQTPPEPSKEETINFTKEQQWSLDFATQVADQQSLRENLRVAAETLPRTGGEATVIAPIAGRVIADKTFPVGTAVIRNAELASIVPPTNAASDLPALEFAETEAKVSFELAQRDRQRAERLLSVGAVPARRLDEAKALETTVQARLQAAQARISQFEDTRAADGGQTGAKRFSVRAPISGIISEASAISGSNVEVGKILFRIVDTETLFVSGVVPESDFSRLRQLTGAEIEMPNSTEVRAANRLVSVGRLVDPETRTVSVVYEVDNRDRRLAVNQTVFLRLLLTPAAKTPVVPEAAVVDDGGRPVAFVQRAGETFVRRPLTVGIRNGGLVQVLDGLQAGERVVVKGAYLVRLSAMSNQIPAHGHIH